MNNNCIYKNILMPILWNKDKQLNPKLRNIFLKVAYKFYEKTKFIAPIIDVYLMGSSANYNWGSESDIDIHIIIDYSKLQMPSETSNKIVKVVSTQWNLEHNILIKGHKLELNFQDINEVKPYVTGIYSLVNNKWIRQPIRNIFNFNRDIISVQYNSMKKYIESVILSGDREKMKEAKEYIDSYRQYGLDSFGEMSYENIVYKILRNKGILKKLKISIVNTYDKSMSVKEIRMKDINSRLPQIFIPTVNGKLNFKKLTLDNLKAIKNKLERFILYYRKNPEKGDKNYIANLYREYSNIDNEIQNRLKYINNPIKENNRSHFTMKFGSEKDVRPNVGVIYLNGKRFLHTYKMPEGWGSLAGKWVLNKGPYAFELNFPTWEKGYNNPEDILPDLENWYNKSKLIKENNCEYFKNLSDEELEALANKYFSIGHDEENDHYSWIWDRSSQTIKVAKNKTHSMAFGYPTKDFTFSGRYDPEKKMISLVFPDRELRKLGDRRPTIDDVPERVYQALIRKFSSLNKTKPKFIVMEYNKQKINENFDYDAAQDFFDRKEKNLLDIIEFFRETKGTKLIPWITIPASLLKKVWLEFGKYNRIDVNDLDKIYDIILNNIARLAVTTELSGNTPINPRDEILDSFGIKFSDEDWYKLLNTLEDKEGHYLLSDYALEPLEKLYVKLYHAKIPEDQLYIIDKILNIIHQRSDLASLFVEGGIKTLLNISNQGGYDPGTNMKEGYGAGNPEEDPLHVPHERWTIKWGSRKTPKIKKGYNNKEIDPINLYVGFLYVNTLKVIGYRSDRLAREEEIYGDHQDIMRILKLKYNRSGMLSWRYRKDLNRSFWWYKLPNEDEKEAFEDWLKKNLGMSNPSYERISVGSESFYIAHGYTIEELNVLNEKKKISRFKNLKKNKIPLTDEERKIIMDAGAIWHHGPPGGKSSPAIWKSNINGQNWYTTNTHRAFQSKKTLKAALNAYKFIKTTA